MRIREALQAAAARFGSSDSPRLDAEVLLAHVLGKPRAHLFAWPEAGLRADTLERYRELVQRHAAGEPLAHLTGKREFWSLELEIDRHTLVPRPDTERLVQAVLDTLPPEPPQVVLDAGTGSGAIALALAGERPRWQVFASDIDPRCLTVAQRNVQKLRPGSVHLFQGRWCDPLQDASLDALVSNPPYIAADDPHLHDPALRFEPRHALVAGERGLAGLRRLARAARRVLRPGGWLFLEHGFEQAEAVRALLQEQPLEEIETLYDLAGHPRVTRARRPDATGD